MKKDSVSSPSTPRDARFGRYCSMGLGTAVLAGAVTTMDASVVYTNYNNLLLADTNTADTTATSYDFDFNGDGTNDIRFFTRNEAGTPTANYARVTAGVTGGTTLHAINVVGISASGYNYPSRLNAGATISAARAFTTLSLTSSGYYLKPGSLAFGNGFPNSKWSTAGANSGFLGVSFQLADGLHYGFLEFTVAPQTSGTLARSITLKGIGYETTPNMAITTFSQVPEPTSIGLVALGGLGLAAYRRRRAAAKATV